MQRQRDALPPGVCGSADSEQQASCRPSQASDAMQERPRLH